MGEGLAREWEKLRLSDLIQEVTGQGQTKMQQRTPGHSNMLPKIEEDAGDEEEAGFEKDGENREGGRGKDRSKDWKGKAPQAESFGAKLQRLVEEEMDKDLSDEEPPMESFDDYAKEMMTPLGFSKLEESRLQHDPRSIGMLHECNDLNSVNELRKHYGLPPK